MSMCRVFYCVVGRGCLLWPLCFLGRALYLASIFTLRPNLAVITGISSLPTFAFQSPIFFSLLLSYQWAESDQLLWELPVLLFLIAPTAWHLDQILRTCISSQTASHVFCSFVCVSFLLFFCSQIHSNLRGLILHLSPGKWSKDQMKAGGWRNMNTSKSKCIWHAKCH